MKVKIVEFGHADEIEVPDGTTYSQLVFLLHDERYAGFINGEPITGDTVLKEGQMLVVTDRDDDSEDLPAGATADNTEKVEEPEPEPEVPE